MAILAQTWPRVEMRMRDFYSRIRSNPKAETKRCGMKEEVYVEGELVSVYYLPTQQLAINPQAPARERPDNPVPTIVLPEFEPGQEPPPLCRTSARNGHKVTKSTTRPSGPNGQPICAKCGAIMKLKMRNAGRQWFWSCPGYPSCDSTRNFSPRDEDLEYTGGDYEAAIARSLKFHLGDEFGIDLEADEAQMERRRRVRNYKITDRTLTALFLIATKNLDRQGFIGEFWPDSAGSPAYVTQLKTRGLIIETPERLRLSYNGEAVIAQATAEGKL